MTKQMRGSSLLLVGRILSLGVNFAVQVLIVRYLSKDDYGAFAYALAIAFFAQTVIRLGLDRAITRFIPIYQEQDAYDRVRGTLRFVAFAVIGAGVFAVVVVYLLAGVAGVSVVEGAKGRTLLLILILLAPLEAVNDLFVGLFAVFSRPMAIFVRRYVLTSSLRLVVSVFLVVSSADVAVLAVGYVATAATGVAISTALFVQILRSDGLLQQLRSVHSTVSPRVLLAFTFPILTTDLVYALMTTLDAVLVGHFKGAEAVATLAAVQPAALLNQIVFSSFLFLFTPAVSRLFAQDDRRAIEDVYWQTTAWIAVLSAPIFLLTFSLASPLTTLLFGGRYEDSAAVLSVLALGYYLHSALGFNGTTLMVFGRIRTLVALNIVALVINTVANLIAIPRWGALGAALATALTLLIHNVLKQIALQRTSGVRFFRVDYARLYLTVAAAALALLVLQTTLDRAIVSVAAYGVVSVVVLAVNRRLLQVADTFPELLRVPGLRRMLRA
jgi:O-antigen/teichoic acid export membrane protein